MYILSFLLSLALYDLNPFFPFPSFFPSKDYSSAVDLLVAPERLVRYGSLLMPQLMPQLMPPEKFEV